MKHTDPLSPFSIDLPRLPRGCRNNNPLNIRRSRSQWLGKIPFNKSTDTQFEQFETMNLGIRAAMCLLRTYINKYKLNSVSSIIRRWAPASDGNNVDFYVSFVSGGFRAYQLNPYYFHCTSTVICVLVKQMALVESSLNFDYERLQKIYCQYFSH